MDHSCRPPHGSSTVPSSCTNARAPPAPCPRRRGCRARRSAGTGRRRGRAGSGPAPALRERGAEMRRAGREIGVVQVVGLDAVRDEGAQQGFQRRRVIVHAGEQDGLASIGMPASTMRAQASRAAAASSRAWFAWRTTQTALRRAAPRPDAGHALRLDRGHPRVARGSRRRAGSSRAARRSRAAAAARGSADRRPTGSPPRCAGRARCTRAPVELGGRQRLAPGPDRFAPEAEAAVDGAGVGGLQQHAVRIAMGDAGNGRGGARRSGRRARRRRRELGLARHELARDRIGRSSGSISAPGRRERDRPARRDGATGCERGATRSRGTSPASASRSAGSVNRFISRSVSSTGAHSTSSIRSAPVASITSRSKPSAMPALAGRPCSSAARKSGSIG